MASPATTNADGKPESDSTLPDASSNPVVAKVLKNFVEQYETRDTVFQDSIIDEVRSLTPAVITYSRTHVPQTHCNSVDSVEEQLKP